MCEAFCKGFFVIMFSLHLISFCLLVWISLTLKDFLKYLVILGSPFNAELNLCTGEVSMTHDPPGLSMRRYLLGSFISPQKNL